MIKNKKYLIIGSIALTASISGVSIWYLYQNSPAAQYGSEATTPTTNVPISTKNDNPGSTITEKSNNESSPGPGLPSDITPSQPTGTFVSNHRPNLDGEPAPNRVSSTCTTTPGATCTIRFTKGSIVKSLPALKTNSDGNINWDWTLQEIGLDIGEWQITAVASNETKEVIAADALPLVVEQ